MNNKITAYDFHGNNVRVVADEQNEPWFVGKDVAEILGYLKARNAIAAHVDDEDKKDAPIQGDLGGTQSMTLINESGLYSLILSSKLPTAKEFKRWVTSEVLPSIRRDGAYVASNGEEDDETLMARALQAAQRAIERRDQKLRDAQAKLDAQAPKVLFADAVAASDGTCLVGELAKMLTQAGFTIGGVRLFQLLRENGYLGTVGQNWNVPKQRYVEMGLFRIKETAVTHADGHVTLNRTPKVTGKGQTYFLRKYAHTKEGE